MLIQSLILIGTMFVLTGAILTSTLLTAKAVLHQTMLTKTQAAMSDATQAFVASTQQFVEKHGTEQRKYPIPKPTTEALCAAASASTTCPYLATMAWEVTGTSAQLLPGRSSAATPSNAAYLANNVDEQRISATISVTVSNATGKAIYAEKSREITARIFDLSPYAVITATRDLSSNAGSIRSSEGDTAGTPDAYAYGIRHTKPTASYPSYYTDTRILTSVDCSNSKAGAANYIGSAYFDPRVHPYGNLVWHNEASCLAAKLVNFGVPAGYIPPSGPLFVAQPADPDSPWTKGDQNGSDFAR